MTLLTGVLVFVAGVAVGVAVGVVWFVWSTF